MLDTTYAELKDLYNYWHSKLSGRSAPARSDIKPEEMRHILPHILLMDVIGRPPRFRYRLAGTSIDAEYGAPLTGKFLDEIDLKDQRELIIADHVGVVTARRPSLTRWSYTKVDGRTIRYEQLLLPLSSDNRIIDMILGGAVGRGLGNYPSSRGFGVRWK